VDNNYHVKYVKLRFIAAYMASSRTNSAYQFCKLKLDLNVYKIEAKFS